MRILLSVPLMAMLHWANGQMDPSSPGCAVRCWENTQYVSKRRCAGDAACLCTEPDYQIVVSQCLYSQCDTVHFGSALHHIIAQCFGTGSKMTLFALPPIPNREDLRRREEEYAAGPKLYGSGSAARYPTESVSFLTQSAGYPTMSVGGPYTPSSTPTPPHILSFETATSPAITSATPTEPIYNAIPAVTTAAAPRQVLVGLASVRGPVIPFVILAMIATLYLTL